MSEQTIELKCWPEPFMALLDGRKTFEWRKDDRPYAVGATLRLREWDPAEARYTGRETSRAVTYMLRGRFGVPDGFVVLGLAAPAAAPPPAPLRAIWRLERMRASAQDVANRGGVMKAQAIVDWVDRTIAALAGAGPDPVREALIKVIERVQWKGSFTAGDRDAREIDIRGCVFEGDGCEGNDSDGHDEGCPIHAALAGREPEPNNPTED